MKFGNEEANSLIDFLGVTFFPQLFLFPKVLKWTGIIMSILCGIATLVTFIVIYNS